MKHIIPLSSLQRKIAEFSLYAVGRWTKAMNILSTRERSGKCRINFSI